MKDQEWEHNIKTQSLRTRNINETSWDWNVYLQLKIRSLTSSISGGGMISRTCKKLKNIKQEKNQPDYN